MLSTHPTSYSAKEALLEFLPLIYVAWADGGPILHDLAREVKIQPDLTTEQRELLQDWLDPQAPPRVGQLKLLLVTIRQAAAELSPDQRLGLAQLGLKLASRQGPPTPQLRQALTELEQALGVAGSELTRELLGPSPLPAGSVLAGPDAKCLQAYLDGDHASVRAQVRAWLEEPEFAIPAGLSLDEHREKVWEICRELAKRGLTRYGMPRVVGGKGDLAAMLAAFQTLAYLDYSVIIKLGVQIGLFGGSLYNLGTERHQGLVRQAFELELPGCFAMTERNHGSNVKDLETEATYDRTTDEFVIHTPHPGARKEWIGNAARHARMATVFAQLTLDSESYGVHAFLVPIRDEQGQPLPGVRIEDCGYKLGLNGVDNGKLWFDQVRIPRSNLLDRFAQVDAEGTYTSPIPSASKRFFTMIGTLVLGRISLANATVSAAKTGVALAIEYTSRRRQFGPVGQAEMPVLDYQAQQLRLMPALATCFALDFAARQLVDRFLTRQDEEDDRQVEALAAGLKAVGSWETMKLLQICREACGGQGYLWANRFANLKADLDVFTTFEGDNTVLMQLVARSLLTAYRQQFSELRFSTVLKVLADQAGRVLQERNPITSRLTSEEHLRDSEVLRSLLRAREDSLLVSAARRLKTRIDRGTDSFLAFNECQDHMINLARAYVDRVLVECFQDAVTAAPAELRSTLKNLCDLFALQRLYQERAWYLEHGLFEASKSKAVRKLMVELCARIRPEALALVRSFGIPDSVMRVPMLED